MTHNEREESVIDEDNGAPTSVSAGRKHFVRALQTKTGKMPVTRTQDGCVPI